MTNDLIEKFITWAKSKDWTIELAETPMNLPEKVTARYRNIPKEWLAFITNFADIVNSTDDMWFLTCENYLDCCNDFENMSLEAADGDETWTAEIKAFWDNTFPIIMSVGGDYQYFAIEPSSGKVVQGWEPEFEDVMYVAESFEEFLEKLVDGEIELVV